MFTFVCLFAQGVAFWFLADMYMYRCDSGDGIESSTDWWSGQKKSENATVFLESSCEILHYADRGILMVNVLAFIFKNVWFAWRVFQNSPDKISLQTHFVDLSGLSEFNMPEPLTWISPKKNSTLNLQKATVLQKLKSHVHLTDLENSYVVAEFDKDGDGIVTKDEMTQKTEGKHAE